MDDRRQLQTATFLCWAGDLDLVCARRATLEERRDFSLDKESATEMHLGLKVHLVKLRNCTDMPDGKLFVREGALRVQQLLLYYYPSRFKVLCEVVDEEDGQGQSFAFVRFQLRASMLGGHLKMQEMMKKRQVSLYDCLSLIKSYHDELIKPGQLGGRPKTGEAKPRAPLKSLFLKILETAEYEKEKFPSSTVLDKMISFVVAIPLRALQHLTCAPVNQRIGFIFYNPWTTAQLPDESADLALKWVSSCMNMTKERFKLVFEALAATVKGARTPQHTACIESYENDLRDWLAPRPPSETGQEEMLPAPLISASLSPLTVSPER